MSEPSADVSGNGRIHHGQMADGPPSLGHVGLRRGCCGRLHTESRGGTGAVLAIVYLALLGVAFIGFVWTTMIDRADWSLLPDLLIGLLVLLIVSGIIGAVSLMVGGSIGRSGYATIRDSYFWGSMVDPPPNVFGWMLLYFGLGGIAFSSYRHFYADRAVVSMSSMGIRFHRPRLGGLFIPWQEVRGVGHLVVSGVSGIPFTSPYAAAVTVGQEFFEQHVAPKRSFLAPPGSEAMFQPKGEMMQVVLSSADMTVKPEDFLGPAEARWKAFGEGAGSSSQPGGHHRLWTLVDHRLCVAGHSVSCASGRHGCGLAVSISAAQRLSCF